MQSSSRSRLFYSKSKDSPAASSSPCVKKPRFQRPVKNVEEQTRCTDSATNSQSRSPLLFTRAREESNRSVSREQVNHLRSHSRYSGFDDSESENDDGNDVSLNKEVNREAEQEITDEQQEEDRSLDASSSLLRSDISDQSLINLSRDSTVLKDLLKELMRSFQKHQTDAAAKHAELLAEIKKLKEGMESQKGKSLLVPKELSRSVVRLYNMLPELEKWELSERFTSETNQRITEQFLEDMEATLGEFSRQLRYEACKKYFYGCRKEHNLQEKDEAKYEKVQEQKKMRSRRVRLWKRRSSYIREGEEKRLWEKITQKDMSDEEDGDDCFKVKTPVWRSPEVNSLVRKLDERHKESLRKRDKRPQATRRVISHSPMKRNQNSR